MHHDDQILTDPDGNLSIEKANWYLEQSLVFFKCCNILFFDRGLAKIFSNFSLSHNIFDTNSSTFAFATFQYFQVNFVN